MGTSKLRISGRDDGATPPPVARGPQGAHQPGGSTPRKGGSDTPGPNGHNDKGDPVCDADPPVDTRSIQYKPVDEDLLKLTKVSATPVGSLKTLARHGDSLMLHGNNRITLHSRGRPLGCALHIFRVWRVWSAPLDAASGERSGDYTTGGSTKWTNDSSGITLWVDVPGVKIPAGATNGPATRHLNEFLVGIEGHPEAGGIYFNVRIDVVPGKFRVQMSRALHFDEREWQQMFPFGFTFTARNFQEEITVATVLHKPFADEDGGLAIELVYGWTNFP